MDNPLHSILKGCLANVERALHVSIHVAIRRHVGVGDGNQCCQVKDDVHVLSDVLAVMRITNVAVEYFDFLTALHVLQPPPVVE